MQTESATGRNKVYHYYNCSMHQKSGGCRSRRISAGEFDAWMMDMIVEHVLTRERMKEVVKEIQDLTSTWESDRDRRMTAVVRKIKEAGRRRQNLFDILELHGKAAPNLGDLTIRLREINDTIKRLERELSAIEDEEIPAMEATASQIEAARRALISIVKNRLMQKTTPADGLFHRKIVVNEGDIEMEYRPERIVNAKSRHEPVVHSSEIWLPEQGSNLRPAD